MKVLFALVSKINTMSYLHKKHYLAHDTQPKQIDIDSDKEVLEWIRSAKFDMVVVDSLNDCGYGLAYYFKAKLITCSTLTVFPYFYDTFGLSDDSSWAADMPHYFPPFEPTFFTRMATAVHQLVFQFVREYWYFPAPEEITQKGLAQLEVYKILSFREIEMNTSLTFVTTHYAQEYHVRSIQI